MLPYEWAISATVAILAAVAAGITDTLRFKVYNVLTFPLAVGGLVFHSWMQGIHGFYLSAAALVVGLLVLIVPYGLGALGAGDVKFFAAVLSWLGMEPMLTILIGASLASGVYSAAVIVRRRGFAALWFNIWNSLVLLCSVGRLGRTAFIQPSVQEVLATSPEYRQRLVPFSAMIGVGILVAVVRQALEIA